MPFRKCLSIFVVLALGSACSSHSRTFPGDDQIRTSPVPQGSARESAGAAAAARDLSALLNGRLHKLGQRLTVTDERQESLLATDLDGDTLHLWKRSDPGPWTIPVGDQVTFSMLSRDGQLVAVTTGDESANVLTVWDVARRRPSFRVPLRDGVVRAAWFGPDHSVVVCSFTLEPGQVSPRTRLDMYDVRGGKGPSIALAEFTPTGRAINEFSSNERTREHLVAGNGGNSGAAGYVAWKPGEKAREVDVRCNLKGVFSSDGSLFACPAGREDTITVFDTATHRELTHWTGRGAPAHNNAGAFTFFDGSRGLAVENGGADGGAPSIDLYAISTHTLVGEHPIKDDLGLSAEQFGGTGSLVYGTPDPPNSGLQAYQVFPAASIS